MCDNLELRLPSADDIKPQILDTDLSQKNPVQTYSITAKTFMAFKQLMKNYTFARVNYFCQLKSKFHFLMSPDNKDAEPITGRGLCVTHIKWRVL